MKGIEYPTERLKLSIWDPRSERKSQKKQKKATRDYEVLKNSIAENGIKVPIMVVKKGNGYAVVGGRHRLRAAKELGFKTVPISIDEDAHTELDEVRDAGIENYVRMNPDDKGLHRWVAKNFKEGGYKLKNAMLGVKSIDNYFSRGNGATWESLVDEANLRTNAEVTSAKVGHRDGNPLRYDPKFITICKRLGYAPKYQYQLLSVLVKLNTSTQDKADKKGLSIDKQISLTTGALPEHPKLQSELIDEIVDMSSESAKTRVQEVASGLDTGRIKKDENSDIYIIDGEVKKEDDKVLPPINTRIIEINTSINKFLFNMTERSISKGEHKYTQDFIRNTRDYRLEIVKTLDERNLINLEQGLKLVQLVTNEMLKLVQGEFETLEHKKELMKK